MNDTTPVVPADPTVMPVTNVTPAPVVPANTTATVTETVADVTQVEPTPVTTTVAVPPTV